MTPQSERDDVGETPGQERIRRTGLLFELHEGGTFVNEQEILCFADIQAEEVKWLWYPYIPYGKITILQGDPGCGKTMAVLSLAALLSKGESLPFEEAAREPINILYQTSEDGIADTIKPRLESAGANCTRIKIINEEKRALTFDDPRLEQSILQENARLLILDPLSAYIGPTVSIAKALIAKGRKDGGGRLKWDSSKITRILRNPTYMGYCVYNRTQTTDLLEHSRKKNNDEETYILKKGNFTPIIDEELWHRCNDIRRSRQRNLLDENGKPRKYGGTVAKNVWVTKLVCHCGSKLRRYLWNTKADGTQVYGFECYRHKKQSALYLKKHGLPEGICELKAFPEWKLELMARKIFETVWGNRREAVLEACRMLNACYREESTDPAKLKALDKRMDALNQRLDNLIMMKASNQITLSQFVEQSNEIGVQQQRVNKEKAELLAKQGEHKTLDMDAIEASLCEAVDFTDGMVSEWFIQNFVRRITPIDDTRFAWVLDLAPEPQTLVCEVNGRKEYPRITLESNLYRGAWPPPGASRQTFLINRNGRLNGDISAAGLAQDRQQSRILRSFLGAHVQLRGCSSVPNSAICPNR